MNEKARTGYASINNASINKASASKRQISDSEARDRALSPDQSFIVQAPAGSGKTGLLVYRMLKLLARVDKPEQVLAITFTRKATSEMRNRLLGLLTKAEAGIHVKDEFEEYGIDLAKQVLQQSDAKEWQLMDSPRQLQILTIDAFCAKLTGDMPWLSRLGDKPKTTDQADSHYAAAIELLFNQLLGPPSQLSSSLKTVMLELDFDYQKTRRLFTAMLGKRDQWLRHLLQNDITQMRPMLETAWREICEEHMALLRELLADPTLRQLLDIATRAAGCIEVQDSPLCCLLIPAPPNSVSPDSMKLEHWKALQFILLTQSGVRGFRKTVNKNCGFPARSSLKGEMVALLEKLAQDTELLAALQQLTVLPAQQFSDSDWQQIVALDEILKTLAAYLQLRFRAVGECDHSEVAQRANLALQELDAPTDLALRIDYQLQHILVDEFQDTSHNQLELLKKLTAGWQPAGTGQAQTLFLVGDPTQSIYRFREADVSLFLQVADNSRTKVFDNIDIEPLRLTENFRSGAALVDWFNATFTDSFPVHDQVLTGAISYAPATSNKRSQSSVQYLLGESKQQEADLVVQAIQAALTELPNEQAQVAVLVRSRTHLKHLLPAIRSAGIAYSGVEIQPLKETPAVIDAVTLCKAICRMDDRISWLALLRGPWCGLSLAEIKRIAGRQEVPVWQQLQGVRAKDTLDNDAQTRLTRFTEVMRQALFQRQQVALHSLVRWTWLALGGQHTLMGAQVEDVQTVFVLIEQLQSGGDLVSISDFDQALDRLYARPARLKCPRVVVSTMHKAKGLQYHTVVLPSLNSQSRADDKDLLMWAEHTNRRGRDRLLLAPIRLGEQQGSHFDYLRALEKQRNHNEMIRLMYVACTRAQSKIVLIGRAQLETTTGRVKAPVASSLLATIWDAVAERFVFPAPNAVVNEQTGSADMSQSLSQTLWRLPSEFSVSFAPAVEWQLQSRLQIQDGSQALDSGQQEIEYQWATEVATAVGMVLHSWLQFNSGQLFSTIIDRALLQLWRAELTALRVPVDRQKWALDRMTLAITTMQTDEHARFIFKNHKLQRNEYALSTIENGSVNTYRLDRTFVDQDNIRWIVDYKSTYTRTKDVDAFVDEQTALRHRTQLEKYGRLMSKLDSRPIKLAVYFPLLGKMRTWKLTNL